MEYCTYCAEALTKPFEVCPHCNKILDFDVLMQIYHPGKTSAINRKALRKIWFKEHRRTIMPAVALFIGLVMGATASYGFGQKLFKNKLTSYESRIAGLLSEIEDEAAASKDAHAGLQRQLETQEQILGIVMEQKELLSSLIRFTNRLAKNSTVTPNSTNDADYYKRNVRYLASQFQALQEKLKLTGHTPIKSYNLQTIPQLLQGVGQPGG